MLDWMQLGLCAGVQGDLSSVISPVGGPVRWRAPDGLMTFYHLPGHSPGLVGIAYGLLHSDNVWPNMTWKAARMLQTLYFLRVPLRDSHSGDFRLCSGLLLL